MSEDYTAIGQHMALKPQTGNCAGRKLLSFAAAMGLLAFTAMGASPIHELKATARDGQVFLTWQETETAAGTAFNVYLATSPIIDVAKATRVGHHVERQSARDWWEDPASF